MTVADSAGNTYTQAVTAPNSTTFEAAIFFAVNIVAGENTVTVTNPGKPAYLVVVFPPQHHGEESVSFNPGVPTPQPPRHDALSGVSWLAFQLPPYWFPGSSQTVSTAPP